MEKQSGDIELTELFAKFGDFFKSIGHGILKLLAILRNVPINNKILFITLILSFGALGFYYASNLKKNFYESSMILSSDYLNKRIIENSIEKLNLLAGEANPKGLAHTLKISDSLASNIVSVEAKPFVSEKDLIELEVLKEQLKNAQINSKNQNVIDEVVKRIEIENRHAFEFTVRTYSPAAIKPLQDAFVNYYRTNEYINKRIQVNHELAIEKKNKLLKDSQKLDSLKKVIYSNYRAMAEQSRQGSNNVILSDKSVTNPIEIYYQDQVFYKDLQTIERDIFLQPDFEVVDGFTEFDEPASASKIKIVLNAMLIGLVLGYLIVALKNFNNYLSAIS